MTPWTVTVAAGLFCPWGFSRPECWSGLLGPLPGDLPDPGIEPRSATLQVDSLPSEPPGKPNNPGVGSLSLLQGIFPTQESNQDLLHCRRILHQLSYQGSQNMLICHSNSGPYSRVYSQRDSDINSQMLPDVPTHTFTYIFLKSRTCLYTCIHKHVSIHHKAQTLAHRRNLLTCTHILILSHINMHILAHS